MAIPNMSDEQMRTALKELEQAIYNHDQWAEMLYGTLICRLTPDQRDMGNDAHRMCRFAQWYYQSGAGGLGQHPGFLALGTEHEHMHQYAAGLLRSSVEGVPISIGEYERFVTALKRMRLETATLQRELEDALRNLDPLTGAPGRLGMLTKLREQREMVKRGVHACAVAMLDLDHFKAINDRYGHGVGDKVLSGIARHITAHLRPYDKLFRYGGEEFLLCLPDADLQKGRDILERLRTEIGSLTFDGDGKGSFNVTVSCGYALLEPELPVEQAIDRADRALYVAKAAGRDRVVAFDPAMDAPPPNGRDG